jgi:glucokinase
MTPHENARLANAGGLARPERPILALDLGGTNLRTAVVMPDGRVVGRRGTSTPTSASEIVDAAVRWSRDSINAAGRELATDVEPDALGISAPGPLDPWAGVLTDPPNLDRSLWDFALAPALRRALGIPAYLERDTQVAALGEGAFGAARGLTDYVYLTVSTGVGGAVVSAGRLLRGADGNAGELGHLSVDADGPLCGCGARGHLEAIASGTAIARAYGASAGSEVAAREAAGDERAHEVMETARAAFAAAMVSIVDVFNPQRVIVGGGVAIGQGDRLLDPAREAVQRLAFRRQAARVEIVPAQLGDDVGLIGALALVRLARVGEDRDLN